MTFGLILLLHPDIDYSQFRGKGLGGLGIAGGILTCVAGAIGVVSYKAPQNHCKAGLHLLFSSLACCVSVVGIIFFTFGVM